MENRIRLDVNHMMADFLGMQYGIERASVDALEPALKRAQAAVEGKRGQGWLGWMELPYNQEQVVEKIEKVAARVRAEFDTLVVLGIGGSALGPSAVQQALNHLRYNDLPKEKRNGPKLYVEDNIDPERMASLLDVIDLKTTCFNVITKSGATAETMSQYLIILDALKKAVGDDYARHIIATTDAKKGNLIKIAQKEGYDTFIIPDGVGGRFSELCPVGLVAAACCGIDIRGLLKGAADMDQRCKTDEVWKNPALLDAGLMFIAMQEMDINISVMMPYVDSLKLMADWYAQLWAESLGKRYDNEGHEVFVGQTPVKALGVTDQHSQVQLYTEGPFDKVVVLLGVEEYKTTLTIPKLYQDIPSLGFLGGVTQNQLIQTEQMATEYALLKSGRPNLTITLPRVNEFMLGQLLYFFEVATAFTGELLQINAFDQPGVEEGKNATYAMFGRPGYEEKKRELEMRPAKKDCYIL